MPPNALPYRVVQWSTGTVGACALRAVIEHPRMSLVGAYRAKVEAAWELAGSSVHSTGSSLGFISEALPLVLTSNQRQLTALTIDEYAALSQRNSPDLLFHVRGLGREAGPVQMVADAIGLPLDSGKARGELAMASQETIAAGTLAAGTVAAQRITVSGIRTGFELIRFRATWYGTADLDPRMGRPTDGFACVGRRPTGLSTPCPTSAPRRRASTRRWTFRRSSRYCHEKHILLSGELKLQEKSLLLTPAPRRCQSCETNTAHMSYAPAQREATP